VTRIGPQEDPLLEWLAWLMDESIKLGPYKIGIDGFLGLIPGLGDLTGGAVSAVMIARAMQYGVPKSAIMRMVINVGIDSMLGSVPLVGDLFDFVYKSNTRNLEIYRESLRGDRQPVRDWAFVVLVAVLLLAFITLPILGLVYLVKLIQ
jgi:hypothetical protein